MTIESRQFKQEGIFQFFTEYSENIVDVVTCFDKNGNLKWKDNLSGNINGLDCNAGNCFVYGSYPRGGFGKAGKRTDPYIWTFDKFGKPGWRKKIATKECEGINGIFFGKENESLFAFISGDSGPTAFWVVMNGTCMDCSSINVRTIFKSNEQLMYAIVSIETENGFQKKNKIFVRPVHSNGSSPWKWSYDMSEKESFWEDRYPLNTNGQWAIGNNNVFLAGYIQSRKESIPPWNSVEQLICFNIDLNGKMLWKASFDM